MYQVNVYNLEEGDCFLNVRAMTKHMAVPFGFIVFLATGTELS